MKTVVCTISTSSHLFKVHALFEGLKNLTNADLKCLVTDAQEPEMDSLDVFQTDVAKRLIQKYKGNKLRWACKSLYLEYLLNNGYDQVIYVDNDIYFYSSPDFLFKKLETSSILLTPHFYPANPQKEQIWLEANYKVGLFNAGFIGVNKSAIPMLNWWAECCLYNVKKSFWRGLFDDQKYLDLVPVLYNDVEILKHKGCNVAGWNIETSPRSLNEHGGVLLDGNWPLVFVHWNYYSIECLVKGKDEKLNNYWDQYLKQMQLFNHGYNIDSEKKSVLSAYFTYFRYKLLRLLD